MTWFDRAAFGMFVHWGHCSQRGLELSWPMVGGIPALPYSDHVPVDEYYATAATFDPAPGAAEEWADLARRVGMTYGVFTSRHHDGFSMFPSKHSDFCAPRDLVGEYVEAFRSRGLRVGLYYSLSDWHHPDYPAFTDDDLPYKFIAYRRPDAEAWERYLEYLVGQVMELLTNYGRIDVLWFDGQWERTPGEWRAAELRELIRSLQPECLVTDRLPAAADYETPEQFVPAVAPDGPWETCMTMNSTWGWHPGDIGYKSPRRLVHTLCEVAGHGGNLLLNVSPRGDGSLPPAQVERLEAVARWMSANGSSIVDTAAGLEPWQFYGPSTQRDGTYFVHLLMRPYETVTVRGVPVKRIAGVRHLASGEELEFSTRCAILDEMLNPDPMGEVEITVPEALVDDLATVLELRLSAS